MSASGEEVKMLGVTRRSAWCVLVMVLLTARPVLTADEPMPSERTRRTPVAPAKPENQPDKPETEKATAKAERVTAIVGGDIITVSREVIRRGTILIQNGKIAQLGQNLDVPKDAQVIDATGLYVAPGFVAISAANLGIDAVDRNQQTKLKDALDPYQFNLRLALAAGVTTACVEVGSSRNRFFGAGADEEQVCPCCGLPRQTLEPITISFGGSQGPKPHIVLKFAYGNLKPMLVKEFPFYYVDTGSLMGALNRFEWRDKFRKGREYLQAVEKHEQATKAGQKSSPPPRTVPNEILQLIKKETTLRISASSVDQIRDMIQLAKELDYKLLLEDVHEGWLLSEELGEARIPVAITPRSFVAPIPGEEETTGSSIELPGSLERAGVPFAISSIAHTITLGGLGGRDLLSLPLEAAFAVRGGCSERTALAAITLIPAQILGISDRVGSIEVGKDADLILLDGSPLDYRTFVQKTLIEGEVFYDRSKDHLLPDVERQK